MKRFRRIWTFYDAVMILSEPVAGEIAAPSPGAREKKGYVMNLFGKPRGKKYHTRSMEVTTYEYDARRLAIEGRLTDRRFQDSHLATGEKRAPGILHQMIIRLLVDRETLAIEDLHVEMPGVPRDECRETQDSLEPVKGRRIARGFTSQAKALSGGGRGCNHLTALLAVMGSAAIQGYAAAREDGEPVPIADLIAILVNGCWTWRAEGPLISQLEEFSPPNEKREFTSPHGKREFMRSRRENIQQRVRRMQMDEKERTVIEAMKKEGKPMRPGDIAKKAALDKTEVTKIIEKLKKEGKVIVPKRCFYAPAE